MREGTCSKGPSFRFLCSLMVHRMPLAKNASWELVCHLNALFVSSWKFESCKQNTRAAWLTAEELFESYLQEVFF